MATIFNKVTIEDELLQKAYNDYLEARDAMGVEALPGLEDLASLGVLYVSRTVKTRYLSTSQYNDACIKMDVELNGEREPWIIALTTADSAESDELNCVVASLRENLAARVQPFSGVRLRISGSSDSKDNKDSKDAKDCTVDVAAVLGAAPDVNVRYDEANGGDVTVMLGDKGTYDGRAKINTVTERKIQRLFSNVVASRMVKSCESLDMETVPLSCVVAALDMPKFKHFAEDENLKCFHIEPVDTDKKIKIKDKKISFKLSERGPWRSTQLQCGEEDICTLYERLIADSTNNKVSAERLHSLSDSGTVLMPYGGVHQLTPAQAIVQKMPLTEGNPDNCMLLTWSCNPQIAETSPYHAAYLSVVESLSKLAASGTSLSDVYLSIRTRFDDGQSSKLDKTISALLGAFEAQIRLGVSANIETNLNSTASKNKKLPPVVASFAVTDGRVGSMVTPEFKAVGHRVVFLKPYGELNNKGVGMGLPAPDSLLSIWTKTYELLQEGKAVAAYAPGSGGVAEALLKMSLGNNIGCNLMDRSLSIDEIFGYEFGGIILELNDKLLARDIAYDDDEFKLIDLGITNSNGTIWREDKSVDVRKLIGLRSLDDDDDDYEEELLAGPEKSRQEQILDDIEGRVYVPPFTAEELEPIEYKARSWSTTLFKSTKPKVVIPVFPGTTGEQELARALRNIGAMPELVLIKNYDKNVESRCAAEFAEAMNTAHVLFIPGGNYGGDAADESNEFALRFLRKKTVKQAVLNLVDHRKGLICGVAEGFGILLRLGLLPFGRYIERFEDDCLLELFATEGDRFAHRMTKVRIATNASPWLRFYEIGEVESLPVMSREYRLRGDAEIIKKLVARGQVVSQFVDLDGEVSMNPMFNPGMSPYAIEGLISPGGRIIGRLGHFERVGEDLNVNVPGVYTQGMLEHMMRYFR